jgi:hypothetical protein
MFPLGDPFRAKYRFYSQRDNRRGAHDGPRRRCSSSRG